MRKTLLRLLVVAVIGLALIASPPGRARNASGQTPPITFFCADSPSCPAIPVAGDPEATLGGNQAPFRGYGDPSLERDPATGTLWLSYSWFDTLVSSPGPPPAVDFGVRTHLARSDDGGATFSYVRAVNQAEQISHPDTGVPGWTMHEVSTLAYVASAWQLLWLTYFEPYGQPYASSDFYYTRTTASSPGALGDTSQPWARGNGTSASFGVRYNLSTIPQLSDCVAFTEPALFVQAGVTFLATNCVVVVAGVRRPDLERLVLLREDTDGYSYVGVLLSYADALDLGGTRVEQADLSLSRSGALLLIVTPIQDEPSVHHLGCVALHVTDLASAQVQRDAGGHAVQLADITADDPGVGAGLCTYDPASQTGVIIVLHKQADDPFDMEFTMHATGVHPDVVPSVGGIAEAAIVVSPGTASRPRRRSLDALVAAAAALAVMLGAASVALSRRARRPGQ